MAVSTPVTATSDSPDGTRAIGAAISRHLRPGDVVLLSGDLGAGKTVLVQGIASGLGVVEPVTSPTFALLHEHQGPGLRLLHADAWRLSSPAEAVDLALAEEVGDGRTALVVEWGELVTTALPGDHLRVVVTPGPEEDERSVELFLEGPSWDARRGGLLAAVREGRTA